MAAANPEAGRPADRESRRSARSSGGASAGDARRYAELSDPFPMRRGGVLHGARLAYETWGELSPRRDNAILLFTGLSPSAHAASSAADPSDGWWEGMIGPGCAIDTRRFHVICVNSLGSCFGSTGPASIDPATGGPYRVTFPDLSVEDIARAGREALTSLGIARAHAVIGPSLGGMVVLAYLAQFPDGARNVVSISGTAAASPFAIALRSIQREAILRDPDWRGGSYTDERPPETGMRIARKLGMMTYRSAAEWRQRFGREPAVRELDSADPFGPEFAIQSYLEAHARRFVRAFDPNCYLYLSRAMDRFDLAEHGESVEAVFTRSRIERALVIGVESDLLFPVDEQRALAAAFEKAHAETVFAPLDCLEGHDSFLIDLERFGREITRFLA
ncbi:MAG TPA: homoserine O-acetyltransferase [Steroidobacteraceae bacterium]|nr:homoserine O-acetyltransferase [Steroidobacteraceae bacterium]